MKLINIVGARPQFIKLAPILKAICDYNKIAESSPLQEILIHTGQHYDYQMSGVFFDELGLKSPDYHLGVGSGSHGYQTGQMLEKVEQVLFIEKPDLVIVYGDTNSTLAGALAAVKLHIPVAHIEAGLRSFNRKIPEEINRLLTDHISDLLFCPTETAVKNLHQEGITRGIYLVGDVMYDAALMYLELAKARSNILQSLGLKPKSYALATIHRAENTDDPKRLMAIIRALGCISKELIPVVFPVHPRTRKQLRNLNIGADNILMIDPVSYLDMLLLEQNAAFILTDSGGVQKEAYFFRVPCVTLREQTEWVETIQSGWNVLAGADPVRIVECAHNIKSGSEDNFPYGDGKSATKIIEIITNSFIKTASLSR